MERYEKKRFRAHLSPNGANANSYVFSPIENWSNDNVWQYLMQHNNPWGQSNKDLLAMYSGASADGECPLVIDTSTPSCGTSRFGCWVCTMVSEDKSMAAMIKNDEEKAWMLPLLDFRNEITAKGNLNFDRDRRDFRRKDGKLTWFNGRLVHGPYTKEVRESFLRKLLLVEKIIHDKGPTEIKTVPLITMDELRYIRKIWLDEKHEFEDSLPSIYEEVTRRKFDDDSINKNKYFGKKESVLLKNICHSLFPKEDLLPELLQSLLDNEAKASAISSRRNIIVSCEREIKKAFFQNESNAEEIALIRLKTERNINETDSTGHESVDWE
jgi:DNA sulfur modification protein DndC